MLGEGGLGVVVKAFDTRLKRFCAIKMIKRSRAIDIEQYRALEERFAREAEAGSRMGSHPNLVVVYDAVTDADDTSYLILEYVAGGTLAQRLKQQPLSQRDALRLTMDAARGLQAAHNVGIVHRDIKPPNIFIAEDGRAQVGDFGVAQSDVLSARTEATTGHPGTPLYMSPEQAQTTGYLRSASDQYSLGLVLFEMVTGKAYKRLSETEVTRLLESLPSSTRILIERMTAERPDMRYSSLAAVSEVIEAIRWSTPSSEGNRQTRSTDRPREIDTPAHDAETRPLAAPVDQPEDERLSVLRRYLSHRQSLQSTSRRPTSISGPRRRSARRMSDDIAAGLC